MKTIISILLSICSTQLISQVLDTAFFPKFIPYAQNPIINFGDDLFGSPWDDPTVLKESNQYIMYMSGTPGGLNHPDDTIGIYRWLSSDGYSWSLNPITPVLVADVGTYYEGGVETPSVVFYKGEYHMYNTVYRQNVAADFTISHATSTDGLTWKMHANPVLSPDSNTSWMGIIAAEPGVMVKDDTLYMFFSAVASYGGQSIGLARSIDGVNFLDTIEVVKLPEDVYPVADNYVGLSTPSPIMIGDTIYLFTDVAQFVLGNWTQVALHQFKSYKDVSTWYHDSIPIHTLDDFPWTSGNYLSEIRSITPLLDGNKLRLWYAGHRISEIDTLTNDTTNYVHFIGNELHVDSGHWAIGTSEYLFENPIGIDDLDEFNDNISIDYHQNKGHVKTNCHSKSILQIFSIDGQLLFENSFFVQFNFHLHYHGLILIHVITENSVLTKKAYSY